MSRDTVESTKGTTTIEEGPRPLRILFLSDRTGGGHQASAEALGKQFQKLHPGSEYEIVNLWTDHGDVLFRGAVQSYKHMSANPWQWRAFYHLSNNKATEVYCKTHAKMLLSVGIKERIQAFDPDAVISVHPTMNSVPQLQTKLIAKELGKHIPFYTVVTDLGSAHSVWFEKGVNRVFVASKPLYEMARYRGIPEDNIEMVGLPIRDGFSIQAQNLKDRTTDHGKNYQSKVRLKLGLDADNPIVLVMGGGEGVGSLSDIVNQLYFQLTIRGIDATICVICGRNKELQEDIASCDWEQVFEGEFSKSKKRTGPWFRRRKGKLREDESENNPEFPSLALAESIVGTVGSGLNSAGNLVDSVGSSLNNLLGRPKHKKEEKGEISAYDEQNSPGDDSTERLTEMATDETPIDGTKSPEESPNRLFLTGSIVGSIGTGMNKLLRRPDETTSIDETTEKDIASDVKGGPFEASIKYLLNRSNKSIQDGDTRIIETAEETSFVVDNTNEKATTATDAIVWSRGRRSEAIKKSLERAEANERNMVERPSPGNVKVIGLGFIANMPEYMVAADILVSKAGPGTIAEAASVGLPILLTSFLPGQEAGNVDVVIDAGFGDYCDDPQTIGVEVSFWLRDESLMKILSLAAQKAGHPNAAYEIAMRIGQETESWVELNERWKGDPTFTPVLENGHQLCLRPQLVVQNDFKPSDVFSGK